MPKPLPVYPFRLAPTGLATKRQLLAYGLRPGGQDPVARLEWRRGERFAWLYGIDAAKPKRAATPAQLAALDRALAARRVCPSCGETKGYCIPTSLGECLDCAEGVSA